MAIIPANWNLPDRVRSRLSPNSYGRQRAIFEEGHLILVLHLVPKGDEGGREGALYWRNPAGEWRTNRPGSTAPAALLRKHVQEYLDLEASLSETYDRGCDIDTLFALQEQVTPLERAARHMYMALQSAREQVDGDPFVLEMRDLATDVERNLEILLQDLRHAIQFRTAKEAELQNRLMRESLRSSNRLNILAALFLPITAITGVFGMNLASGIDAGDRGAFWIMVTLSILAGAAMTAWVMANPKTK